MNEAAQHRAEACGAKAAPLQQGFAASARHRGMRLAGCPLPRACHVAGMIGAMHPTLHWMTLGLLAWVLPASADGLRPESGVLSAFDEPSPYELRLRRELLRNDVFRLCQMLSIPPREPERAVFMLKADDGSFTVISRTLKDSLWHAMFRQMDGANARKRSHAIGPQELAAALKRVRAHVRTEVATLEPEAGALISEACEAVLLKVAQAMEPELVPDGTRHHASHWVSGAFLSGTTSSPEEGSLAADFVAMEDSLRVFAEAKPQARAAARSDLLGKARQL
ncbi:MAG: hypothetical protein U1E77_13870 [Inhella sp.]